MIKRYNILSAGSPSDLINQANKAIEDGWQPIGGVIQAKTYKFMQAMVRSETAMDAARREMRKEHECVYLSDGGACTICGKTAIEE